jgi:hypothetical protein
MLGGVRFNIELHKIVSFPASSFPSAASNDNATGQESLLQSNNLPPNSTTEFYHRTLPPDSTTRFYHQRFYHQILPPDSITRFYHQILRLEDPDASKI